MSSKYPCPTVPPLYTWDSGTKDLSGTDCGTTAGQGSIKALAQAFLAVPLKRDKVGQEAGQGEKSCPTKDTALGQTFSPPDPAALAHARRMLVSCPVQGRSLHCWYCSRCSEAGKCPAWRSRRADVEFFRKSEKPYSLYLVEEMESGEVLQ